MTSPSEVMAMVDRGERLDAVGDVGGKRASALQTRTALAQLAWGVTKENALQNI